MESFQSELQKTEKEFLKAQKKFLSGNVLFNLMKHTHKYRTKHWDKLPLYIKGKIAYGCIVQANTILFKDYPAVNCPAAIVFSHDDYFKENPEELREAASLLYSFKNEQNPYEDIKAITDAITDEYQRLYNVPLPAYLTHNKQVYYTTIMVYRRHLPGRKLIGSIFPIVSDSKKPRETYILPCEYWTQSLKDYFMGKHMPEHDETENAIMNSLQ